MGTLYARLSLVTVILLQFSTIVSAGPLDDHYLQQFGETKNAQLQKAILSDSAGVQESARCGMPLKHGLRRDWNLLEQTTQKTLAKQLAAPTLTWAIENTFTFTSAANHFKVHYTKSGADAPPLTDVKGVVGVPDWVEDVAATFETVYAYYGSLGYRPAPTNSAGAPYDIYLLDLAVQKVYGTTTSDKPASSAGFPNAVTSWMEIDNNFTDPIYNPATPLQSLQITAAHEYHHAVQYGYNVFFDVWYAEATSNWMEDELYDNVNQLYNYIPAWFGNSATPLDLAVGTDAVTSGAGYGRWIFNRYLSEKHGPAMIRGVWERVAGLPSPSPENNADIPMVPVLESVLSSAAYGSSLGNDFFGFAKRVYQRDWTTHTSDLSKIHPYSPVASFDAYPASSSVSTLTPSINLPHYSFAYYKFTPTAGVTSMRISVTRDSGIQTVLFKNGVEIPPEASGSSYVASGLGTADELVLLVANSSNSDNQSASFSTDGKIVVTSGTAAPAPPASSGGGSGCFIATAAYGSYLHPQVQLLRNFRDEHLLTNAPGRAFVALYYRCSPKIADLIVRHPVLRGVTRLALTPLVVSVAHPLISAASLFLLAGALLMKRLRRIKAARSNARPHIIRTT